MRRASENQIGGRTHLIEDHLLAHIVHFLSMTFSRCHRCSDCEQTHQQGAELDDIRVLQLRSGVNNAARDEFSVRGGRHTVWENSLAVPSKRRQSVRGGTSIEGAEESTRG